MAIDKFLFNKIHLKMLSEKMSILLARTKCVRDIHDEVLSTPVLQALIYNPYMYPYC